MSRETELKDDLEKVSCPKTMRVTIEGCGTVELAGILQGLAANLYQAVLFAWSILSGKLILDGTGRFRRRIEVINFDAEQGELTVHLRHQLAA